MTGEIPEHIYRKEDIDKAYDMGVATAIGAFEKTIGMSKESQRLLLQKIKDILIEDRKAALMGSSYTKF